MQETPEQLILIEKARQGDAQALAALAETIKVHLEAYIGRMVLNEELTGDLVQETLLIMCERLKTLKTTRAFWYWLRKIALNCIRAHYRTGWSRRTELHANMGAGFSAKPYHGTVACVIRQEFETLIFEAIQQLPPKHRVVLCMRCYDQMGYDEMARILECTEFSVRTTFYRAKKSLAKSLAKKGLGQGALVLALTLYGKLTATTQAAVQGVSVTGSILGAGMIPWIAASGLKMILCSTAGVLLTVASVGTYVHYQADPWCTSSVMQPGASQAGSEFRYCFPPHSNGAVFLYVRAVDQGARNACTILQNDHVNTVREADTVTLRNAHLWSSDLTVMRLPTDSTELTRFLDKLEGRETRLQRVSPDPLGQLVTISQQGLQGLEQHVLAYDMSDEEFLQYGWPAHIKVVDQRDAVHERGWAHFEVAGHLDSQAVTGSGRIPFVLAKKAAFSPWFILDGQGWRIEDNGTEAVWIDTEKTRTRYCGGSFFSGLNRPWMGLHMIDTVRRDAAEAGLPFSTRFLKRGQMAEVCVQAEDWDMVYTINMQMDWVEKIIFFRNEVECGRLEFSYGQNVDLADRQLKFSGNTRAARPRGQAKTITWLFDLAEGVLK